MQLIRDSVNNFQILHIQKDSPISYILFLIRNGSRFETPENTGISHFIEHMMFKQTEKRTTQDIAMDIETIGGQTNAFTGQEYTGYYIRVLEEKFDNAFEILSDILQNGKFTDDDINIERGNIIEEIRMYEDSPSDLVWQYSHQNIFPDQMLGRPILGNEETISKFNRNDLVNFLETNYLQEDFLIVSVGSFGVERIKDNISKYMKVRNSGALTFTKAEFNPVNKVDFIEKKDSKQAHVVMSFPGVSTLSEDLYKFELLEEVLGGGMGSILWSLLREKLGVAYYVGANHSDYLDTGVFNIYFGANSDKTKLTIDKVFEELDKVKSKAITKEELERAQNLYYASIAMAHESINYLGQNYGIQLLLEGKIDDLETAKKKIYSVTADDIQNIAKQIFGEKYNITYIANKELI